MKLSHFISLTELSLPGPSLPTCLSTDLRTQVWKLLVEIESISVDASAQAGVFLAKKNKIKNALPRRHIKCLVLHYLGAL